MPTRLWKARAAVTADDGLAAWGANQLAINGYADVNLDIEHNGAEATMLDLLLDNYGVNNPNEVDGDVDNLVITGGNASGADSLELTSDLPASLEGLDVSGFEGGFTASFDEALDSGGNPISTNTIIKLGSNDAHISLVDDDNDPTNMVDASGIVGNTTFEFTDDGTAANPSVWVIDSFVGLGNPAINANNNNKSFLDLGDLGISNNAQLDFADGQDANGDGNTGVVITAENGATTWMIELTGLSESDLNTGPGDNFLYA